MVYHNLFYEKCNWHKSAHLPNPENDKIELWERNNELGIQQKFIIELTKNPAISRVRY